MAWPHDEALPEYIDSSSLCELAYCPKSYYYSSVRKLTPRGSNIHLSAGGAYASALEAFRKTYYAPLALHSDITQEEKVELFHHAAAEGLLALIISYKNFLDFEEETKNLYRTCKAYESYLHFFHPTRDHLTPVLIQNQPAVETSFAVPISNTEHPVTKSPIIFCGKMDLVARVKDGIPGAGGDSVHIVDDKTSSQMGANYTNQFQHRSQFTGYGWALMQYGFKVAGILVRGTAILKTETRHQPVWLERPLYMIAEWETRLRALLSLRHKYFEEKYWPQYGMEVDACQPYHRNCKFFPLCNSKNPEAWIETEYEKNTWNPINQEDQKGKDEVEDGSSGT